MQNSMKEEIIMLRVNNIKLKIDHTEEELTEKLLQVLKIQRKDLKSMTIRKRSIDARKKEELKYIYCIDVSLHQEGKVCKRIKNPNILKVEKEKYVFPKNGEEILKERPVIVGAGPAGLFCAYMLAEHGYRPIIVERGEKVEERTKTVEKFWKTNVLHKESNVQFGEGGAGTFSDGKLNTLVKEKAFRNRKALEVFVKMGADPSILYVNKPHIGTDVLKEVIKNMRNEIIRMGGEFYFQSKMTDIHFEEGKIQEITLNEEKKIKTDILVLAIGHSARDTFALLKEKKLSMEAKPFAVGFRMEHPQEMINESQYGKGAPSDLPAAPYKLAVNLENGRGVYTFCMCPTGISTVIVPAAFALSDHVYILTLFSRITTPFFSNSLQ